MNADPPHLDLTALLAADAAGAGPRAHLAACTACRTEAARWAAVAGGVRQLAATAPEPPDLPALTGARPRRFPVPGGSRRGLPTAAVTPGHSGLLGARRTRRLTRPGLIAAAAAGILAAGGIAYGVTTASGGAPAATGPANAGLISVRGCPGLYVVSGTLHQIRGTSLILTDTGNPGHQPVTVTTSASTRVLTEVTGTLSGVTDGRSVIVHGFRHGRLVAAANITVGVVIPQPRGVRVRVPPHQPPAGIAIGTAADVTAHGFTVITNHGHRRVPVTTSTSTTVYTMVATGLHRLTIGGYLLAVGQRGVHGTLAAGAAEQGSYLPHVQWVSRRQNLPFPGPGGCSPVSVATTALFSGG